VKRILLTTLALILLACLLTGFFALFNEGSLQAFLYLAILTIGNILIPTFIGVLLFQVIKKKVVYSNWTKTYIIQILVMVSIMVIGLFLWALVDVMADSNQLTLKNVMEDFYSQFSGFALVGVFMAIAIPFIDRFLTKTEYANK
jgi:flagellar biosynthesis protein FlhB